MADTGRRTRPSRASLRSALFTVAGELLERGGPESLQARTIAAAAGTSTQSLYTLFGGMPGLIQALAADGFVRLGAHVDACALSDDPVADHFSRGWAYYDWALAHPQRYRLMFGLTGRALRPHAGLELTTGGAVANFPEGRAALDILLHSVQRVIEAGRIHQLSRWRWPARCSAPRTVRSFFKSAAPSGTPTTDCVCWPRPESTCSSVSATHLMRCGAPLSSPSRGDVNRLPEMPRPLHR